MKELSAVLLCLLLICAACSAMAVTVQYDYEMKTLYDKEIPVEGHAGMINLVLETYGEGPVTLKDCMTLWGCEEFDLDQFINSEYGEYTANAWYTYATYADPMDEQLLAYWERKGLIKEKFADDPAVDDGITGDYYVYSPVGAAQSETAYPVIFCNHGGGENAFSAETHGFCQIACKEGIILIMAETTTPENLYAMLQHVKELYPVDESRIYSTGTSAGGNATKNLAYAYPTLLAAIVPMDKPPQFSGSDEALATMIEKGMPTMFIGGLVDMYYQLNGHQGVTEGRFSVAILQDAEPWNKLLSIYGVTGYDLTCEQAWDNMQNSLNVIENLTGYTYEKTTVDHFTNNRVYVNSFTDQNGIESFKHLIIENRGHVPCGHDAEYAWEFMRHFSRDLTTGESIYTENP